MENDYINLYRYDLTSFVHYAFNILNAPCMFQQNWHIDAICHALEEVERGNINRLIINAPPRYLKSFCTSVAFPLWCLGRNPHKKILSLTGGITLGKQHINDLYSIARSSRFKGVFPNMRTAHLSGRHLDIPKGGYWKNANFMGNITGLGADIIIIDDPISPIDVHDETIRRECHRQFDYNIIQRLNSKHSGAVILVTQRLHELDLTDYILSKHKGWHHIDLSAIAIKDETWQLPYGRMHHRKKHEALHPERESMQDLYRIMREGNKYSFAYQYLQGQYKPHFDADTGCGYKWINDMRVGEDYTKEEDIKKLAARPNSGFYGFYENDIIKSRVFSIGDDPMPNNIRNCMTTEEWITLAAKQREFMLVDKARIEAEDKASNN